MKRKLLIPAAFALCLTLLMLTSVASAEETGTAELMGSFEGAAPIDVNEEQKGALLSSSDSYTYLISLDQPGVVSITFSHDFIESSSHYWNVRVFEYNDMEKAMLAQRFKGNERDPQTTASLGLPAGRYYIVVDRSDYCEWSNVTYRFTVNYTSSNSWEKENNDSLLKASDIPVNQELSGSITRSDDEDYYLIELPSDGYISVEFSHDYVDENQHNWNIRLFEFNDTQSAMMSQRFKGNERDAQTTTTVGLPAGQYYIVVDRSDYCDWSNATYRFIVNYTSSNAWEKENNDSLLQSTAIPLNQEISGSVMRSNDADHYLIELPSDGYISVEFSHDYIDENQNNWNLRLYEYKDTETVLFSQRFKGNERDPQTTTIVGLPAGQYYIIVDRSDYCNWSNMTYRFTVNYTGSDAWEKENNGERMTATQIYFNKEVRGTVMMSGDKDYYTFTLAKDDNVSFSFGHEYVDNSSNYWNLTLYSENDIDHAIHSSKYAGTERNNLTSGESALPAGKYYLCIERYEWSSVPYTLTVNAKSQEGTPQPFEQKYLINGITVQDTNGKALNAIPNGDFQATVSITNLTGGGESWVLLASYTKEGQFVDFTWARTKNFSVGGTFDFTVPINNPSGKIKQLKAFTVASLSNLTPLGNSASFPSV